MENKEAVIIIIASLFSSFREVVVPTGMIEVVSSYL